MINHEQLLPGMEVEVRITWMEHSSTQVILLSRGPWNLFKGWLPFAHENENKMTAREGESLITKQYKKYIWVYVPDIISITGRRF